MKFSNFVIGMFVVISLIVCLFPGCSEDKDSIINKTDKIYTSIKIIITDKDILPLIPAGDIEKLLYIENKYLSAVQILRESEFESSKEKNAISEIIECTNVIVEILEVVELPDVYDEKISNIRILLKVLSVYLE